MRVSGLVAIFVAVGSLVSFGQTDVAPLATTPGQAQGSSYVPVHKFDPKRDAVADIEAAIQEAQGTGKRIILDVGGDWCSYCHEMDQFFQEHSDLLEIREENFITVAVYYSSENKNEKALSHYPKVLGIPHFFVLEKDGTLLQSQHIVDLRAKRKYDANKMKDFLIKWSPPRSATAAKAD
jgi:thioredoxin-related protein